MDLQANIFLLLLRFQFYAHACVCQVAGNFFNKNVTETFAQVFVEAHAHFQVAFPKTSQMILAKIWSADSIVVAVVVILIMLGVTGYIVALIYQ